MAAEARAVEACRACDGLGCPTCKPLRFGLPRAASSPDPFDSFKDPSYRLKPAAEEFPELPIFLDRRRV